MTRPPDNPYPPTKPALQQAFEEGVRAARWPVAQTTERALETEEEQAAWFKGFIKGRKALREETDDN